jgi:hypothetical protein
MRKAGLLTSQVNAMKIRMSALHALPVRVCTFLEGFFRAVRHATVVRHQALLFEQEILAR